MCVFVAVFQGGKRTLSHMVSFTIRMTMQMANTTATLGITTGMTDPSLALTLIANWIQFFASYCDGMLGRKREVEQLIKVSNSIFKFLKAKIRAS